MTTHGISLRIKMAAKEVARPVFLCGDDYRIVVFAPLFSLQGVEGKLILAYGCDNYYCNAMAALLGCSYSCSCSIGKFDVQVGYS